MKSWSLLVIAALISMYSCDVKRSSKSKNVSASGILNLEKARKDTLPFTINTFKVPDDIEGCGYYFSPNEQCFKTDDFNFVANKDGVGYISVDNIMQKLKLTSTTRDPENFGDHVDTYVNKKFKVTVEIKYKIKAFQEDSWTVNGTLLVESKDGRKLTRPFFGEKGC